MQSELEGIKGKFATTAGCLAEMFRVILKTSNELFEKGKSDAYVELISFCHAHCDSEGRVDKTRLQDFLEEKIKDVQMKENK